MAGRSGKWAQQESETPKVGYVGFFEVVTQPSSYSHDYDYDDSNDVKSWKGQGSNFHQTTTRNNIVDKQSGDYMRTTFKESNSTGEVFKERSTGRYGYKDEYKTTSTAKIGDKSGYFEYQREERFRRVDYEDNSSNSNRRGGTSHRYGNKNYLE